MSAPRDAAFATAFAVVFALVYVAAVEWNLALFTWHPAIYELGWGAQAPRDGPAMYWYGWLSTSFIAAVLAGLVARALPEALRRRLPGDLVWIAPLAAIAAFCWLLRNYFLR